MAFKSPGIYFTEIDNTEYMNPAAEIITTVAIIGFAKQGPIGVPTEITSYNDYKQIFGTPISGHYAGLAVRSILSSGGVVLYTRVADETLITKSNVVLKATQKFVAGRMIINKASDTYVGYDKYQNGEVYYGTLTDAKNKGSKTLVIRTPEEGKLTLTNLQTQLANCLPASYGNTEYVYSVPEAPSFRNFFVRVTGTKGSSPYVKTFGPYFVDVLAGEDGDTLAESLNDAMKSGTNPYQIISLGSGEKFYNGENRAGPANDPTVVLDESNYELKFRVQIGEDINEVMVRLVTDNEDTISMSALATQINSKLAVLGYNIRVQFCYDTDKCYLLFVATDGVAFSILPLEKPMEADADKVIPAQNSLFMPLFEEGVSAGIDLNETGYVIKDITGTVSETFDKYAFISIPQEAVGPRNADNIPIDADFDTDSDHIIFTLNEDNENFNGLEEEGSRVEIEKSNNHFGLYLFDLNDEEAEPLNPESTDPVEKARSVDNTGAVGFIFMELAGEAASKLSLRKNTAGQLEFYEDEEIAYGSLVDKFEDENLISDILGKSMTQEEFEEAGYISGTSKAVIYKEGQEAIDPSTRDIIVFTAREYGEGTSNIGIEIYTSTSPIDGTKSHFIDLYVGGIKKESWENVSFNPNDDNYFVDLINSEADNGGSQYITAFVQKNEMDKEEVSVPETADYSATGVIYLGKPYTDGGIEKPEGVKTYEYTKYEYILGNNGVVDDSDDLFLNAMDFENSGLANKDLFSWHILITPDNIKDGVQDQAIALCEFMEDAIYIIDPPMGLTRRAVIKWHNSRAFDSNYACMYWPWCKVYDVSEKEYVWVMPSVVMAAQFCKVDDNYAPWYAPAGEINGYLSTVLDIEKNPNYPNKADRDALYLDMNRINPFLKLRNGTVLAYGEKTTQRKNSTLTKIHTRRMLIALKKELTASIKGYLFMPTMSENIAKIRANVTAIMEKCKVGGGVDSYVVVCDETNNTTETLQQDILNIAIICVPCGCIEQVEITFVLNKSADTTTTTIS